ncbi:histidine-phosphotransfer domain HPT domain-containing protein [Pisolithus tinctorius]|uniref:HPt domain-containing protein n=1 Tax=Pisolithus tinctorius Marx 270 TaxID=870435 RepID=A0A0C3NGR0_PISTI|nr:histidine-phosphotransfer domain HPT domain-containing protein [Pisolithus tinctorius]KAI6147053.1 histidine-phosphotransfer domain HPT domain-containing protein [Pisolithus tinctorius]KIN94885.1 hypothetical protein M404DRAFT_1008015 [Pisolithus tinctorius Marx 270]
MSFRPMGSTARSPQSYHDDVAKRPPPSPSNKAPPQKKLDVRSRSLLDEPSPKSAPGMSSSGTVAEPYPVNATKEIINKETFSQLQDLDDDETQEFSRGMVHDYFNQAETTFSDMDSAFAAKDLETLSSRGHFLKGSSAALGIVQVQAICEKIQHLGKRTDPDKGTDPDKRVESKEPELSRDEALAKIEPLLARVKVEHADAVRWLMEYYKALDS